MNPYLLTLTFLMLMSLLTSSEVVRFSQNSLGNHLHKQYQENLATSDTLKAYVGYDNFRLRKSDNEDVAVEEEIEKPPPKPSTSIPRPASLEFNCARPPNNSRLNFYLLLNTQVPPSLYEATARLMRNVYGNAYFFSPNAEYRILDALIALKEETKEFVYPDEMSKLDLGDPELQAIFYSMLKGSEECPSLLNFITFDKVKYHENKKVNLMFADPVVIESLINHHPTTESILKMRQTVWEEINDQEEHRLERTADECKGREILKKELAAEFRQILFDSGLDFKTYDKIFDYSLGKMGTILFIEDPLTGFIQREKYN